MIRHKHKQKDTHTQNSIFDSILDTSSPQPRPGHSGLASVTEFLSHPNFVVNDILDTQNTLWISHVPKEKGTTRSRQPFLSGLVSWTFCAFCLLQRICKLVAICLHYFFCASFSWMFVEGLHMYRRLREKRNIDAGKMSFYYFMGWGKWHQLLNCVE